MTIRVLVVDDQALVRAGFRTILDSEPGIEVVGEAADGAAAIAAVAALDPDVVCMDVQMPGLEGLAATRRIVAAGAGAGRSAGRPAVLVLTTFNRDDYLFEALDAGASGFLLKNSSPEQLIEAVQVVARGDALLSPDVTRAVIAAAARRTAPDAPAHIVRTQMVASEEPERPFASEREQEATRPEIATLTDREREVLALLAEGRSNAEIAERLWVGEATVKTHVSKVLQKLGLRDRVHAVVYAYEHGVVRPQG